MRKKLLSLIVILSLSVFMNTPAYAANVVTTFFIGNDEGTGIVTCQEHAAAAGVWIDGYVGTVSVTAYFSTGTSYLPYLSAYNSGLDGCSATITDSPVVLSFATASFGTTQSGFIAYATHFR